MLRVGYERLQEKLHYPLQLDTTNYKTIEIVQSQKKDNF
jgi:hypothetical protein